MTIKSEIYTYIKEIYQIQPDYPFKKYPSYAVFRHKNGGKWFGLLVTIKQNQLTPSGTNEAVELLNVKAPPEIVLLLNSQQGFLPAYHMNKEHWLSIKLNGEVDPKQIMALIDDSYELTK